MITPSQFWEAADCELIFAMQEIRKELNLRAMCQGQNLPYPPTEEYGPEDTPLAEVYGG